MRIEKRSARAPMAKSEECEDAPVAKRKVNESRSIARDEECDERISSAAPAPPSADGTAEQFHFVISHLWLSCSRPY